MLGASVLTKDSEGSPTTTSAVGTKPLSSLTEEVADQNAEGSAVVETPKVDIGDPMDLVEKNQ